MDTRGHHLATCSGIHIAAHDAVWDEWYYLARKAHLSPRLEPVGIIPHQRE